jgi:ribosomal protein L44E
MNLREYAKAINTGYLLALNEFEMDWKRMYICNCIRCNEKIRHAIEKARKQHKTTMANFERDMIRERVLSGLARARAQGKKLGRPFKKVAI